jgi:hypothetical protein
MVPAKTKGDEMGQRHQIIVVYPKMYLNEGNPNNKDQRAQVIHHQWLYGRSAILALDRVLRLAKNSWSGDPKETDYLFGRGESGYTSGDGTRAIGATVSVDPDQGYYHNIHIWKPADWNGMNSVYKGDVGFVEPQKLEPDMFDNNDGITVIEFRSGEALPRVCFITPDGLEGHHYMMQERTDRGPWTAREYLEFYYSQEEQAKWSAEVRSAMEEVLVRIETNSKPMSAVEVQVLLPAFKIGVEK